MVRFTLLIATAAALAVVVVTGAAGGTRPDDRAWRGVGPEPATLTPSTRPNVLRPDDRAWRGAGPVPTIELTRSPSVRGDGFDWADAGLGAAAAFGLGLLATSAHLLRRHRVAAIQ